MKIDLHCHTIKAKSGDGGRDIDPASLAEALANNQVGIAAITNHNLFDFARYNQCVAAASAKEIEIWPGIEFDIQGKSNAVGHVIVIADPAYAKEFSDICSDLINGIHPDDFILKWDELAPAFVGRGFDFIVMSHYRPFRGKAFKDKALPYGDNQALEASFPAETPFFFEPSNLKRAGIMYAEGVDCLIGSDVKDWSKYYECSLPELKLEISSFNQFLLLLRKTPEVLKTIMDKKTSEQVEITLFDRDAKLVFPIYNDVNVVFGAKGTGKTALLKKIEAHFRAKGWTNVSSYYASENNDKYKQMVAVKPSEKDFAKLGIDDASKEFACLKAWSEPAVTSFESYIGWEEFVAEKADTMSFGFASASAPADPDFDLMRELVDCYRALLLNAREILGNKLLSVSLDSEEFNNLQSAVSSVCSGARDYAWGEFVDAYALHLEGFTVKKMKSYITVRTGNPTKPSGTGFSTFALSYKKVRSVLNTISGSFQVKPYEEEILIGRLAEKGDVIQHRKYVINPSQAKRVSYLRDEVKVTALKSLVTAIGDASNIVKTPCAELTSKVAAIIEAADQMGVSSLKDCLGVASSVSCGGDSNYEPSNGEKAMIVLSHALFDDDASIFILDEPEASMGNEFINKVIVERINKLAKVNKIVVVSTHNANVAVRTLPWQSIYREYDEGCYCTYAGNPFCDELRDLAKDKAPKVWTQVSIDTLEGGEDAFTDREIVYGKLN